MPPETPHDLPNGDRVLVIDTQTAAHNLALMLQRFRSGQSESLFSATKRDPRASSSLSTSGNNWSILDWQ